MKNYLIVFSTILFLFTSCYKKDNKAKQNYEYKADSIITYKTVDTTHLKMEIFYPESNIEVLNSAIVFFYGGGWLDGSTSQFAPHAEYYAKKGYMTFLIDYRVKSRNNTPPFESLKDAKSAMRFIKFNAIKFGIDSSKIIACGGSAGGHLAAATAVIDGYNHSNDDLSISAKPQALVLFNPVIDNGPNGYGYERVGDKYKSFSPIHNIKINTPPSIIYMGTNDEHTPMETIEYYKYKMDSVGSFCDVKIYKDQKHGFFNYWFPDNYKQTIKEMDLFLATIK